MVLIGLLPVVAILLRVWAHNMYTVGFSMNARAAIILTAFAAVDLVFIASGIWLLRRRTPISN